MLAISNWPTFNKNELLGFCVCLFYKKTNVTTMMNRRTARCGAGGGSSSMRSAEPIGAGRHFPTDRRRIRRRLRRSSTATRVTATEV